MSANLQFPDNLPHMDRYQKAIMMLNLKIGAHRRTNFGLALEQSAKEILAHGEGEARLPTRPILLPDDVYVKRLRTQGEDVASRVCPRVLH